MASLDELEMVLLSRLADSECALLREKIHDLLPLLVPMEHLDLMLRHLEQCSFVELTSIHRELFAEATFIGRTVAKASKAELPNMEARLIKRQAAPEPPPLSELPQININNNFSPTIEAPLVSGGDKWAKSQAWASWSSVVIGIAAIVVTTLVGLYLAGKL